MRLAGHGKKVLSLAIAAAMAVSVCTTGWADPVDPGTVTENPGTYEENAGDSDGDVLDTEKQQNNDSDVENAADEQKKQENPAAPQDGAAGKNSPDTQNEQKNESS